MICDGNLPYILTSSIFNIFRALRIFKVFRAFRIFKVFKVFRVFRAFKAFSYTVPKTIGYRARCADCIFGC